MAPGSRIASPLLALVEAGHDLEQRRLAGAVGPDDADLGAVQEREGDVVEDDLVAVGLAHVAQGEDVLSHAREPTGSGRPLPNRARGAAGRSRRRPPRAAGPPASSCGPSRSKPCTSCFDLLAVLGGVGALAAGLTRRNRLVPRLRSCPTKVASTTWVTDGGWPSRSQTSIRSLPWTTTASPLCTESRDVVGQRAPARDGEPGRLPVDPHAVAEVARRAPHPERRHVGAPLASRWSTSLPTQPCRVTHASFIVRLLSSCRVRRANRAPADARRCGRARLWTTPGARARLWTRTGSGLERRALRPARAGAPRGCR